MERSWSSLFVWGSLLIVACQGGGEAPSPATKVAPVQSTSAAVAGLTEIADHAQVCMVTDRYMGKPQIPVTVGGLTYYGCCAGCKSKLESSESVRTATDPVSGASVNKATAVIGRDESGTIFYFESRDNLLKYRRGA